MLLMQDRVLGETVRMDSIVTFEPEFWTWSSLMIGDCLVWLGESEWWRKKNRFLVDFLRNFMWIYPIITYETNQLDLLLSFSNCKVRDAKGMCVFCECKVKPNNWLYKIWRKERKEGLLIFLMVFKQSLISSKMLKIININIYRI